MNNYNPYYQQGYYYNPYNSPYGGYYDPFLPQKEEKREIRRLSCVAGLCILGYIVLQNILSIITMLFPSLRYAYTASADFQSLVGIIFSIVGVLLPFALGAHFIKNRTGFEVTGYLEPPKDKILTLLLIPVGFMLCIVANYATDFIVDFIESIGFKLTESDYPTPDSAIGWIVYTIEVAIVPPLCEEFAVRGVVLQPLRKHGEWFAIIASSMVFAIMHGNLIQAPFAFMCGIVMAYIVCKTNSLWAGMAIHCLNNGFSVLTELMVENVSDVKTQNILYLSALGVIAAAGIACACIAVSRYGKSLFVKSEKTNLTTGQKWKSYILTAPMILAIIALLVITSGYVTWTGGN